MQLPHKFLNMSISIQYKESETFGLASTTTGGFPDMYGLDRSTNINISESNVWQSLKQQKT